MVHNNHIYIYIYNIPIIGWNLNVKAMGYFSKIHGLCLESLCAQVHTNTSRQLKKLLNQKVESYIVQNVIMLFNIVAYKDKHTKKSIHQQKRLKYIAHKYNFQKEVHGNGHSHPLLTLKNISDTFTVPSYIYAHNFFRYTLTHVNIN